MAHESQLPSQGVDADGLTKLSSLWEQGKCRWMCGTLHCGNSIALHLLAQYDKQVLILAATVNAFCGWPHDEAQIQRYQLCWKTSLSPAGENRIGKTLTTSMCCAANAFLNLSGGNEMFSKLQYQNAQCTTLASECRGGERKHSGRVQ